MRGPRILIERRNTTSLEKAKMYMKEKGYEDHIIELEQSRATVSMAAEALGVEEGMIAKTKYSGARSLEHNSMTCLE